MHISEGILSAPVLVTGAGLTAVAVKTAPVTNTGADSIPSEICIKYFPSTYLLDIVSLDPEHCSNFH